MSRSAIVALVSVLALVVGAVFHIEVTEEVQLQFVEVIVAIGALIGVVNGIVRDYKNKKPSE